MSGSPQAKYGTAAMRAPRRQRGKARAHGAISPAATEKLWKKIVIWAVLVCAPCAAVLLAAFVWQMHGALSQMAQNSPPQSAAAAPPAQLPAPHTAASRSAKQGAWGSAAKPQPAWHITREDVQFLHTGLIYSSFLALLAALCIAALLAHFMARDKHHRRAYQTIIAKTDHEVESRVRHRTAHLRAAQKLAEKERQRAELLLQDSSHRIGNSLATVSSLLGLQLRRSHDAAAQKALLSARDRIQAISAAHRRLRLNGDMETAAAGDFLAAVIRDIESGLPPARRRNLQFQTRFEPVILPARDVTTLGIIAGELVTNAVKHAFADGQKGKISVSLGRFGGKTLRLRVEDNGAGLKRAAEAGEEQGLGRLIVAQLARQFGAEPQFSAPRAGGCRVTLPLRTVAEPKLEPRRAA